MEAAVEKLLKAYKAKAKAWRRQVGRDGSETADDEASSDSEGEESDDAVSYTHLTLPTKA